MAGEGSSDQISGESVSNNNKNQPWTEAAVLAMDEQF